MFGMGMGELLLILVVALLVVGPDKLPQAAKAIGKGIRDFRRHSQELQSTLEADEKLGEAVRELRSALRDDPLRWKPPASRPATPGTTGSTDAGTDPKAEPPSVVPAAGAIAKQPPAAESASALDPARPIDARPDPRPAAAPKADDPAHG
ncbi:MAG TPA: twin-arginine translocase TatA/TatE family subunit [Kofleriaceae bacterium]|nr:twin-arginine translocase TatA/TatE family subunit [Kofleriaceae bacterium]